MYLKKTLILEASLQENELQNKQKQEVSVFINEYAIYFHRM